MIDARLIEDAASVDIGDLDINIPDKEIIDTELQLKDLDLLEKKLERTRKMTKGRNKEFVKHPDNNLLTFGQPSWLSAFMTFI